MCGGNSIEERRELHEEPKTGDSLFVEKNCFNRDDPLPPLALALLLGPTSSEFPGILKTIITNSSWPITLPSAINEYALPENYMHVHLVRHENMK